jgi:hypothetical protein
VAFIESKPKRPRGLPRRSAAAWDLYLEHVQAERASLAMSEPADVNEIGEVPMSLCPERRGSV